MARGGYRPGSGRKKGSGKPKNRAAGANPQKGDTPADISAGADAENLDPLAYMLKVMRDERADSDRRDRMAIAAAPFVHVRPGIGQGKKEVREERAKVAGSGKFAAARPPHLEVV